MTAPMDGASAALLTPAEAAAVTAWRRDLHRHPELSRHEAATAGRILAWLGPTRPDALVEGLGGHGVAAVYDSGKPGPALLFRSETDALPIAETTGLPHASARPGVGHLCGHDGHSSILAALALRLGARRPARGRVVLLFQPAEEDGSGAAAVIADPRFAALAPDLAFALHNMPGLPFGRVALAEGPAACASRGLRIGLVGRTAHASSPETGVSPMRAVARLMPALTALGPGGAPGPGFALATVTHARMGAPAFGVAPGEAEIMVTLRTVADAEMAALCERAEALARTAAAEDGLGVTLSYDDVFPASRNDPAAVAHLRRALDAEGVAHGPEGQPMRASEDFGHFGRAAPAAMFLLGAGEDHPALHDPRYDYPDALTPIGLRVFHRVIRDILG